MEMYKIGEFAKKENPTPGQRHTDRILTDAQKAGDFRGVFVVLAPGNRVDYHFHNKRESLLIGLSGEATEIVEGKKYPFKANDIIYMPPGEKHGMINTTKKDFRYLEFVNGGGVADSEKAEWPPGLI